MNLYLLHLLYSGLTWDLRIYLRHTITIQGAINFFCAKEISPMYYYYFIKLVIEIMIFIAISTSLITHVPNNKYKIIQSMALGNRLCD